MTACAMVISIVLSIVVLVLFARLQHTVDRADRNAHNVAILAKEIQRIERDDTIRARDASYRQCEREQRDRAENHFRAGLIPPAQAKIIVKSFGLTSSQADVLSLNAIRKRLPIFDCTPNLRGEKARVMTKREQTQYIKDYIGFKLAPVPAVPPDQDVISNHATASPKTPAPDTPTPSDGAPSSADHSSPSSRTTREQQTSSQAPSSSSTPNPAPAQQSQQLLPGLPCIKLINLNC